MPMTFILTALPARRWRAHTEMETEMNFLKALDQVRSWRVISQQLDLYDASGKLLARFTAQVMK